MINDFQELYFQFVVLRQCFGNARLVVKNKRNEMDKKPSQFPNLKTQFSVFTIFKNSIFLRQKIELNIAVYTRRLYGNYNKKLLSTNLNR